MYSGVAYADMYSCSEDEERCVKNFNQHATNKFGNKSVDLVRVVVDGKTTPSIGSMKSKYQQLNSFFKTASHNQLSLTLGSAKSKEVNAGSCKSIKNQAHRGNRSSAFITVYALPKGVCGSSNASGKKINMNDNTFRTYAHEAGHLLGLAHSNRIDRKTGKTIHYGGPASYMGKMPSNNYALPQLHWLGWTEKDDIIRIRPEDLEQGSSMDITLRPINKNAKAFSDLPIGIVYDLSETQRLFISIPKSVEDNGNRIKGGEVFFHKAPKCRGCRGMSMNSLLTQRIFNPKQIKNTAVADIVVSPISYDSDKVRRKIRGKYRTVDRFESVTLRISRLPE